MGNNLFYSSLFFSLIVHGLGVLFCSLPQRGVEIKSNPLPEITYFRETVPVVSKKENFLRKKAVSEKAENLEDVKLSPQGRTIAQLDTEIKDISKITDQFTAQKESILQIASLDGQRKILIPLPVLGKRGDAKGLNYNQVLRERLEQKAYTFVNHPDFESGEVYLTFNLQPNGHLLSIEVVHERSMASEYLKKLGLIIVKEADPFPPFPRDLSQEVLTINVPIVFRKE